MCRAVFDDFGKLLREWRYRDRNLCREDVFLFCAEAPGAADETQSVGAEDVLTLDQVAVFVPDDRKPWRVLHARANATKDDRPDEIGRRGQRMVNTQPHRIRVLCLA